MGLYDGMERSSFILGREDRKPEALRLEGRSTHGHTGVQR